MITHVVSAITILMLTQNATSMEKFSLENEITFAKSDVDRNIKQRDACLKIANELQKYLKDPVMSDLLNDDKDKITSERASDILKHLGNFGEVSQQIVAANPDCPDNNTFSKTVPNNLADYIIKLITGQKPKQESSKIESKKLSPSNSSTIDFKEKHDEMLAQIARVPFKPQKAAIKSLKVEFMSPASNLQPKAKLLKEILVSESHNKQCNFYFNKAVAEENKFRTDLVVFLDNDYYLSTDGSPIDQNALLPDLNFKWNQVEDYDIPGSVEVYNIYYKEPQYLANLSPEHLYECSFSTDGIDNHLRLRFRIPREKKDQRMMV